MSSQLKIAPPLVGNIRGSFAYTTVKDRWPKIVTKVVDQLHRKYHDLVKEVNEQAGKDATYIISKISEMRYRMETNKPLLDFEPTDSHFVELNAELKKLRAEYGGDEKVTFYDAPWLFSECYLYAKLHEFVLATETLKTYDIFAEEKKKAYDDSLAQITAISVELVDWEADPQTDVKAAILRLIQVALWGNKCDLSLSCGDPHQMAGNMFNQLDSFRHTILADDIDAAVEHLATKCAGRTLHVVLDNSALELFTDMALAEFLVARGLVKDVVFHGKSYPWFVSDVTANDYNWVLQSLADNENQAVSTIGKRWQRRPEFSFRHADFWTTTHSYWDLKSKAPMLFDELKSSALTIFKGDLNYRKLVADRDWPYDIDLKFAVQSMSEIPFFALRTLKAETVAGISQKSLDVIKAKYESTDKSWMFSSDWAVAQLNLP
uniref:Sugar phosphate phosphatase n=1 Tax=Panagrellus redivivus TaxID=6233 RepID=A0A7E4VI22_PANRE